MIIISATIDPQIFIDYFCDSSSIKILANDALNKNELKLPPRIYPQSPETWCAYNRTRTVVFSPATSHTIKKIYVKNDDLHFMYAKNAKDQKKSDIEKQELLLKAIHMAIEKDDLPRGSVALVFVSTSKEADKGCELISKHFSNMSCRPLYSKLSMEDQNYATGKILDNQGKTHDPLLSGTYERKIVFATNIAESSLTIQNLKVVIDTGNELENSWSPLHHGQIIEEAKATQAQIEQRRGRVGRITPGTVYYLYSEEDHKSRPKYPAPAICKADLTDDVLKRMETRKTANNVRKEFQGFLTPPSRDQVRGAFYTLFMYGLVYVKRNENREKSLKLNYQILRDIMFRRIFDTLYNTLDAQISIVGTIALHFTAILKRNLSNTLILVAGMLMFYPEEPLISDIILLFCLCEYFEKIQSDPYLTFFQEPHEKNEKFEDFKQKILRRTRYNVNKEHQSLVQLFHHMQNQRRIDNTPFINKRFLDEILEEQQKVKDILFNSYKIKGNAFFKTQERVFSHKTHILTQIHERIPTQMLNPLEKCILYARLIHICHIRYIPPKKTHDFMNYVTLQPIKIMFQTKLTRGNMRENKGVYESVNIKKKEGENNSIALGQAKILTVFSQKALQFLDFIDG